MVFSFNFPFPVARIYGTEHRVSDVWLTIPLPYCAATANQHGYYRVGKNSFKGPEVGIPGSMLWLLAEVK